MNDAINADIVSRLNALDEDEVLDWFWVMQRSGADRLWLLSHIGSVKLQRPPNWSVEDIRTQFERGEGSVTITRLGCFACLTAKERLYLHHLVEVFHGGSNASRNLVPLCFACHKYLHPWLIDDAHRHVAGFESVRDISLRAVGSIGR